MHVEQGIRITDLYSVHCYVFVQLRVGPDELSNTTR